MDIWLSITTSEPCNNPQHVSREAAVSLPKLEVYVQLVREKLTTLDFDIKRLALEMLNIKILLNGPSVEINASIPVEDVAIATTSS